MVLYIQKFSSSFAASVKNPQRHLLSLPFITPNNLKVAAKTFLFHVDLLITNASCLPKVWNNMCYDRLYVALAPNLAGNFVQSKCTFHKPSDRCLNLAYMKAVGDLVA